MKAISLRAQLDAALARNDELARKLYAFTRGEQPSAWVAVGERLPDDGQTVLVAFDPACDTGEPVWLGWLDEGAWRDADGAPWPVTHWQPIPAPPTKQGNAEFTESKEAR